MSEGRHLMHVLRDLYETGLTVEQQILLNEVVLLASAPRPMTGIERTRKWRQNQCEVTNGDATVTNVTSVTQKEKENPPYPLKKNKNLKNNNTPNEASLHTPKAKRGTRLPHEWNPPEGLWLFGREKLGLSDEVLKFETGAFRDHFWGASGQRGVKINWESTWKNWMREAIRRGRGHGPPRLQSFDDQREATRVESMEALKRKAPQDDPDRIH